MNIRVFYLFIFIFFSSIHIQATTKNADLEALEYCELHSDSHILVIFPSAIGYNEEVEEILNNYAKIAYKKMVSFTENGGLNFILTAYETDGFVLRSKAARRKARLCFPKKNLSKNTTRAYLLQCDNLEVMKQCKADIRALFSIAKHSVHSTDTHEEAVVLARALFNDNSIHFLNHLNNISSPLFNQFFDSYRNWLASKGDESKGYCIAGDAALAAYGLMDCDDFGYLCDKEGKPGSDISGIENHNSLMEYYPISLDDILIDPDYHFFYKGIKFCSLSAIKRMKEQRNEKRDAYDVGLISNLPKVCWE